MKLYYVYILASLEECSTSASQAVWRIAYHQQMGNSATSILRHPSARARWFGISDMWSPVRGWNVGLEIVCIGREEGEDDIEVYETGGSHALRAKLLIVTVSDQASLSLNSIRSGKQSKDRRRRRSTLPAFHSNPLRTLQSGR